MGFTTPYSVQHWARTCIFCYLHPTTLRPPKSNIDTKTDGSENVSPFKHGYFGLSMLDFRGVIGIQEPFMKWENSYPIKDRFPLPAFFRVFTSWLRFRENAPTRRTLPGLVSGYIAMVSFRPLTGANFPLAALLFTEGFCTAFITKEASWRQASADTVSLDVEWEDLRKWRCLLCVASTSKVLNVKRWATMLKICIQYGPSKFFAAAMSVDFTMSHIFREKLCGKQHLRQAKNKSFQNGRAVLFACSNVIIQGHMFCHISNAIPWASSHHSWAGPVGPARGRYISTTLIWETNQLKEKKAKGHYSLEN